jgi:enoyl-CoA hydratase/carnithine racemase
MSGAYETLRCEQAGEIATITLDRPKLNLFNEQMVKELIQVCYELKFTPEIRFVILAAAGKHFSGGFDLGLGKEGEGGKAKFTAEVARMGQLAGHELMRSLESLEQVTVAALKGVVIGAGMAAAMACDFRIMAEDSYYAVPETIIGTYFTWGCTPRLVRMVGASRAMEIVMLCEPIPAAESLRLGLANRVVPADALMDAVHEFIGKIAAKSPTSIRITKKIAVGCSLREFGNTFMIEPELMEILALNGETVAGVEAFFAKRPASFKR